MPFRIEVLGRQHRALLDDFQNQHRSLFGFTRLAEEFPCRMVLDLTQSELVKKVADAWNRGRLPPKAKTAFKARFRLLR